MPDTQPAKSSVSVSQQIAGELNLCPGDIIISEIPFIDASREDFVDFHHLKADHTSIWIGHDIEKGFAHSMQEGYHAPGLQLTDVWPGRHIAFRYHADPHVANQFATIMKNWSSAEIPSNSTPHNVSEELFALFHNNKLIELGKSGIHRAIQFSFLRNIIGEPVRKTGQRCTAVITAAFQASIFASITKSSNIALHELENECESLIHYIDNFLITEWEKTAFGRRFLEAMHRNDYSSLFPSPFAIDQRYATPELLYEKLQDSPDFTQVGKFSYFDNELIAIEKLGTANNSIQQQSRDR
jgi:hypothetical protein